MCIAKYIGRDKIINSKKWDNRNKRETFILMCFFVLWWIFSNKRYHSFWIKQKRERGWISKDNENDYMPFHGISVTIMPQITSVSSFPDPHLLQLFQWRSLVALNEIREVGWDKGTRETIKNTLNKQGSVLLSPTTNLFIIHSCSSRFNSLLFPPHEKQEL